MIGILVSWFSSTQGRFIAIGGGLVLVVCAAWLGLSLHDRAVEADLVARQNAAEAAHQRELHEATVSAFGRLLASEEAHAVKDLQILEDIDLAPTTNGCADSPAMAAALRGLRNHGAAEDLPGHSGRNALVPGRAGDSGDAE